MLDCGKRELKNVGHRHAAGGAVRFAAVRGVALPAARKKVRDELVKRGRRRLTNVRQRLGQYQRAKARVIEREAAGIQFATEERTADAGLSVDAEVFPIRRSVAVIEAERAAGARDRDDSVNADDAAPNVEAKAHGGVNVPHEVKEIENVLARVNVRAHIFDEL